MESALLKQLVYDYSFYITNSDEKTMEKEYFELLELFMDDRKEFEITIKEMEEDIQNAIKKEKHQDIIVESVEFEDFDEFEE